METTLNRRSVILAGALALGFAFSPPSAAVAEAPLKIGVSAGHYADILVEAARVAREQGLEAEIIEFTDWNQPNAALDSGELDLNSFQNLPYLANQVEGRGYKIVPLEAAIRVPGGIWSDKHATVADLPEKAKLGIPNDPTNGARALYLFEEAGVIKLKPGAGDRATVLDIVENPKNAEFHELDASQLGRSLADLDAAFVSSNYASLAGLKLADAVFVEGPENRWPVIIFAAREDRKDDPRIRQFISIYRSEPVRQFINGKFNGTILPAF